MKKASCLHYYHSSIDLHDNLYARQHPACKKRFSRSRFQSSLACSVEKWVLSGVRGEINFTLFLTVDLSALEKSSVCMDTNEKRDNVIAARESLGVIDLSLTAVG